MRQKGKGVKIKKKNDIQMILTITSSVFGAGGIVFGVRERKLRNRKLKIDNVKAIQEIYKELLKDVQNRLKNE